MSELMFAAVMHERGGAEVLRYETMPIPHPAPHEVLVKVHAATVNHTDIFHRTGQFYIQKPLPHVLGMDVAGEIVALGEGVQNWTIGERVVATFEALGRERNGAYAEYTTLPVTELHRVPDGLSLVDAASIGLAFTTAWIGLLYNAQISEGERVVIHAASSGVGTAALQIARWKGAQIIAVSSPAKSDRLREIGASHVIDRHAPDLVEQVHTHFGGLGATLVVDLVGNQTLQKSIEMLDYKGRIVCIGTLSGDLAEINVMDLLMKNAQIMGSFDRLQAGDFEEILRLFAAGQFRAVIDSEHPLAEAREAHEHIERQEAFGKVILRP